MSPLACALAALVGTFFVMVGSGTAFCASKCSANRIKAAGKKAASKLTCHAKAVAKDLGVESTCLGKAEVKFSSAFAKAEAKTYTDDGCLTTGDAGTVEATIDEFVDEIAADLSGVRFVDNGDGTVTDNDTEHVHERGGRDGDGELRGPLRLAASDDREAADDSRYEPGLLRGWQRRVHRPHLRTDHGVRLLVVYQRLRRPDRGVVRDLQHCRREPRQQAQRQLRSRGAGRLVIECRAA